MVRSGLGSNLATVWKNCEPQEPDLIWDVHLCGSRLCASVIKDVLVCNTSDLF